MTAAPYWIVVCRLLGHEDDSLYIEQAATEDEALDQAEARLRADSDGDTENCVLSYLVRCDTKPALVRSNVPA